MNNPSLDSSGSTLVATDEENMADSAEGSGHQQELKKEAGVVEYAQYLREIQIWLMENVNTPPDKIVPAMIQGLRGNPRAAEVILTLGAGKLQEQEMVDVAKEVRAAQEIKAPKGMKNVLEALNGAGLDGLTNVREYQAWIGPQQCKRTDDETVQDFIARLGQAINQAKAMQVEVPEETAGFLLLTNARLPRGKLDVDNCLRACYGKKKTWAVIRAYLMELHATEAGPVADEIPGPEPTLFSAGAQPFKRKREEQQQEGCYYCGEPGHFKRECPRLYGRQGGFRGRGLQRGFQRGRRDRTPRNEGRKGVRSKRVGSAGDLPPHCEPGQGIGQEDWGSFGGSDGPANQG